MELLLSGPVFALLAGLAIALGVWGFRQRNANLSSGKQEELASAVAERTRQLALEKQRAEEANRLKSQFLANVSHEIRTPMNSVLGTLELALMTELTREQREYLEISKTSAESLLALIEDILDFSRIEAEKLEIDQVEFSLEQCVRGAVNTMVSRSEHKGFDLRTEIAKDIPDRLLGDPDRLRQVLLKIIEHALKSPTNNRAFVRVSLDATPVDTEETAAGGVAVLFSVVDKSNAVSTYKRDASFEPFQLADGSANRKYGGTGLGLTICGRLVRLMGGQIWVDSKAGQSSKFYFTARFKLPEGSAAEVPAPHVTAVPADSLKGMRVLLAEDNRVNQVVTSRLLEKHGLMVLVASNGREAVEILQRESVDLILMDVQMPEMDGFEATRRIREQEKQAGKHVPILAMTAHSTRGYRDKCLGAGMDGYLAKPVQSVQLYEAINELLAV
jgi:signal transduction histidine kinase/CheY-like chemotaxis protein